MNVSCSLYLLVFSKVGESFCCMVSTPDRCVKLKTTSRVIRCGVPDCRQADIKTVINDMLLHCEESIQLAYSHIRDVGPS